MTTDAIPDTIPIPPETRPFEPRGANWEFLHGQASEEILNSGSTGTVFLNRKPARSRPSPAGDGGRPRGASPPTAAPRRWPWARSRPGRIDRVNTTRKARRKTFSDKTLDSLTLA